MFYWYLRGFLGSLIGSQSASSNPEGVLRNLNASIGTSRSTGGTLKRSIGFEGP